MLTKKQEDFTQNLFKGLTQRESWIQAGYSSNYALEMVDIHACALANKDKIKIRLQELNEPIIERIQSKKEHKLKKLEEIYSKEPLPEKVSAKERVQAISEHNKMVGDYTPSKVEVTGKDGEPILDGLLERLRGYSKKE